LKVRSKKQESPEVSSFGSIIIVAFLVGEIGTVVIEGIYYARGESSLAVFLLDVFIFTLMLSIVSVTCYFLVRRIFMRLKDSESRLVAANEELAGYAHTVSHDLKGPITGIALSFGAMDMILKGSLDEGARQKLFEIAEVGKRNTDRAERLVSDLLFIAEAGLPKDVEPVDVAGKLHEVIDEQRCRIGERRLRLDSDDDLGTVIASPTQVYELFDNLVKNSIRHSGTDDLVIQVRRLSSNGNLHLLFKDNGSGIDVDVLPRVFDRFVKGAGGDTGLGLSIVRKIVETYGGRIKAYNDGGACFEFEIKDCLTPAENC